MRGRLPKHASLHGRMAWGKQREIDREIKTAEESGGEQKGEKEVHFLHSTRKLYES